MGVYSKEGQVEFYFEGIQITEELYSIPLIQQNFGLVKMNLGLADAGYTLSEWDRCKIDMTYYLGLF